MKGSVFLWQVLLSETLSGALRSKTFSPRPAPLRRPGAICPDHAPQLSRPPILCAISKGVSASVSGADYAFSPAAGKATGVAYALVSSTADGAASSPGSVFGAGSSPAPESPVLFFVRPGPRKVVKGPVSHANNSGE